MTLFHHDSLYYSEKVKQKEVSVTELVERALHNIEHYDDMNAVVHIQKDRALRTAQEMDKVLSTLSSEEIKTLPPFYGVPIVVKDLGQEEEGIKATNGSYLFKDYIAKTSSNFVTRLIDNGFVIVGRTNVPEFGFKMVTDSDLFGNSYAPFGRALSSGGSSGGAAAALKAGLVPAASGSDGGGSIRIPASFNGLIGLKPTRGRVTSGPGSYRQWQGASIDFFLTKSVRETYELLKMMDVQPSAAPYIAPPLNLRELTPPKKRLKIAYSAESPIGSKVNDEAVKSLDYTVEVLKSLGHEVVEDTVSIDGQKAIHSYFTMNMVETASMFKSMEQSLVREITKDDVELISYGMYYAGLKVPGWMYTQSLSYWDTLSEQYHQFLDDNGYDFYLTPTMNGPTLDIDEFKPSDEAFKKLENIESLSDDEVSHIFEDVFKTSSAYSPYTWTLNLTGQPAISLPLYNTDEGLPVGSMFIARKGEEDKLLQLALEIENAGRLDAKVFHPKKR